MFDTGGLNYLFCFLDQKVFLMEMKEDDQMVGESLHTISKGIHDKVIYLLKFTYSSSTKE